MGSSTETLKKPSLSAAALKWIALVSMLIDHATEVLYVGSARAGAPLFGWITYLVLRGVGRLAFPIYAFLLAGGFYHARSRAQYLLRLGVFALLSELPFDLAFQWTLFDFGYQNVFCTLFLGLLAIWLFERATGGDLRGCGLWRGALGFAAILGMAALARLARTDYGELGVLIIAAMGVFRNRPLPRAAVSAALLYAASPLEAVSFVDYGLFALYNGRRGRQPKYFFYAFYPGHLLLLCLLRRLLYGL